MASNNPVHASRRKRKPQNPQLITCKKNRPQLRNNRKRRHGTPKTVHHDAKDAEDDETEKRKIAFHGRNGRARIPNRVQVGFTIWTFCKKQSKCLRSTLYATHASEDNTRFSGMGSKTTSGDML